VPVLLLTGARIGITTSLLKAIQQAIVSGEDCIQVSDVRLDPETGYVKLTVARADPMTPAERAALAEARELNRPIEE
jgi:hypothetical protein